MLPKLVMGFYHHSAPNYDWTQERKQEEARSRTRTRRKPATARQKRLTENRGIPHRTRLPCRPENGTPAVLKLRVQKPYKAIVQQDMVTDTYSLSTQEHTEAGG